MFKKVLTRPKEDKEVQDRSFFIRIYKYCSDWLLEKNQRTLDTSIDVRDAER